ncbi:MAG: phenylalanine--tRNA ligase beta subunit-related protein [Polyangiaceae bacterium]
MLSLRVAPHPLLEAAAFSTTFTAPMGIAAPPDTLRALLAAVDAPAPMRSDDAVRGAVRDLLRHGGYKPTGRGKPASEYLLRAVAEGALGSINAAVDACNAVSLHSGIPISVVDLDRAAEPLSIAIAPAGSRYVFNAGGQEIDIGGLLCLCDAGGPCANAVKDAQRTKTDAATTRTLSVLWGSVKLPGRATQAARWYREILAGVGATTADVALEPAA